MFLLFNKNILTYYGYYVNQKSFRNKFNNLVIFITISICFSLNKNILTYCGYYVNQKSFRNKFKGLLIIYILIISRVYDLYNYTALS